MALHDLPKRNARDEGFKKHPPAHSLEKHRAENRNDKKRKDPPRSCSEQTHHCTEVNGPENENEREESEEIFQPQRQ